MLTIEPRIINIIWPHDPISFRHVSFWPFFWTTSLGHLPCKYWCAIKNSDHIRPIYLEHIWCACYFEAVTTHLRINMFRINPVPHRSWWAVAGLCLFYLRESEVNWLTLMPGWSAYRGAFPYSSVGPDVCKSTWKYTGIIRITSTSSRSLEDQDQEVEECYKWSALRE